MANAGERLILAVFNYDDYIIQFFFQRRDLNWLRTLCQGVFEASAPVETRLGVFGPFGLKHTKRVSKETDASKTSWQSAVGQTAAGAPGCFARRL